MSTNRTKLSMIADAGNAAARDVGTEAGTVAEGDDARITGAVQSADVKQIVLLADQAAYDALDPPDSDTLYLVPEAE